MAMKENNSKAVIQYNYIYYVVDADKALMFMQILAEAERYKYDYGNKAHHVWAQEEAPNLELKVLPKSIYDVAKLAGKPEGEQ